MSTRIILMKTLTARLLISALLLFALAACASPDQPPVVPATTGVPPTATPITVPSQTPTVVPTATETPTFLPTVEPTRPPATFTADVPTDTPASAATETATPVVTPTLSTRNPTAPELGTYFPAMYLDRAFLFDWKDITATVEYSSANSQPVVFARDPENNAAFLAIVYADVNGDGQADLITYGSYGLIVLLWQGVHYSQPFSILGDVHNWMSPDNSVSYADWTGDGQPEIVFDSKTVTVHGTGILGTATARYLVHCYADACQTIWQGRIGAEISDGTDGGMSHYQVDMRPATTQTGTLAIRTVDHGFYLYCCMGYDNDKPKSLHVMTSTLSIYPWTGQTFGLAQEQIISGATRIDSRSMLTAADTQGVVAAVSAQNNHAGDNNNDQCQLAVAGQPEGGLFGCRGNFTTVEWKDITGDSVPDIVIITYSNSYARDWEGNELSDEGCMNQRLLAYQWDGQRATPIANVAGCVIREDLYGVRLADVDGDGKLEIEAAPNGKLQNRAYKWNGKQFVLWSDVPLPPAP
jgi:FG-GAP-like repeat